MNDASLTHNEQFQTGITDIYKTVKTEGSSNDSYDLLNNTLLIVIGSVTKP